MRDTTTSIIKDKVELDIAAPVYFPGLNQVRALAAISVMLCHIEQIKSWYSIRPNCTISGAGITLFFVLSAFLITYLLMKEHDKHDKIDIKKFYLRRICRIWPLYYFVVLTAFFVLPHFWHAPPGYLGIISEAFPKDFWTKFALYMGFLPGLCSAIYLPVAFASQCWTLGVEEQFYLFWPIVVISFRKTLIWAGIAILAVKSVTLQLLNAWSQSDHVGTHTLANLRVVIEVLRQFDAEAFVLGGLAAWAIYKKPKLFHPWLTHPLTAIAIVAAIGFCLNSSASYQPYLLRLSFAALILLLFQRPLNLGCFNNTVDYLGRVSYGLYMYHWTVAVFVAQWLITLHLPRTLNNVAIYLLTLGASVAIAALSYKFLEEPFLRIKKRHAVVHTTH